VSRTISTHRNGWKNFIGGRRFYSYAGMDEDTFKHVAADLEARWKAIKAAGGERVV
jgi:hypothetical protein